MRDRDKPLTLRQVQGLFPSFILILAWIYLLSGVFWYARLGRIQDDIAQNNLVELKAVLLMRADQGGDVRLYDERFGYSRYACSLLPREACDDGRLIGVVEEVELVGKRALVWRGEEKAGVILEASQNGQPWFGPEFVYGAIRDERRWAGLKAVLFIPWTALTVFVVRRTVRVMDAENAARAACDTNAEGGKE